MINVEQRRIPDQLALKADIEPVKVYAYRKTGLIVTEQNWGLLSKEQQQQWEAAITEYEERLSGEVQ